MTIGIDANWLIYENAGIGKYSYNIILEILKNDRQNQYILLANFVRYYQKRRKILFDLIEKSGNKNVSIKISHFPSAWREWLSNIDFPQKYLLRKPIDIYFSPYFSGIFKNGFKNQVVVIYDLVFIHYPEHAGKKLSDYYLQRTKNALEKCQNIITISRSTKNDLIKHFKVDQSRITIANPGIDQSLFQPKKSAQTQKIIKKYGITKPYILSVGTLEPRKNLESLIDAFELLPTSLQEDYQLVLVGKNGWNNNKLKSKITRLDSEKREVDPRRKNQKSKIIETGYVPDSDLPYLYSGAEVFVYPSLYEGFGMPPLEAMACGCPVIVSDNSSLLEVVGEAGIVVEAENVTQIAKEIARVLTNKELQSELSLKGIDQTRKFSWDISAKKIINIFERIKLEE